MTISFLFLFLFQMAVQDSRVLLRLPTDGIAPPIGIRPFGEPPGGTGRRAFRKCGGTGWGGKGADGGTRGRGSR
ncbi:hypothetical protein B0H19DRAFT_1123862 [Mycena capillaripes]|nr:hypothetical protein B0H19DRAFT_1123862 [Mycena capillaripes]